MVARHLPGLRVARALAGSVLIFLPLGSGYSSPIVAGKRLIALYSDGRNDVATSLDAATGEPSWTFELGPFYKGHDGSIDGPLATPCTDGEMVVAVSGHGRLHVLGLEDGKSRWSHDLAELGGRKPYFGFASSPILDGNRVYVLAGGDGGKCVLAFDRDKGSLVWSAASEEIEYSSPALATLAGVRQLVVIGKERVFSVAAADGKELWSLDVKTDGWATPVILPDDRVFLPLEDRLMMVRCQGTGGDGEPEVLWTARGHEGYAHSFGYRDKYLYGVSKRRTVCLDADTGETAWSDRSKESAAIVSRDHLVILSRKEGVLRMIQATPDGLRECLSQEAFPEGSHWTPPVAAKGLLYLRSGADLVAYRFLEE